ncbi:MAG: hypothetical protein A2309_10365 [Bacteroidetes bacterium RIFOXYB2_FULL_35_7]|nr:MAG: hypothetical protein A2309_10365 [Bacteroidetes bacterium RIFOXYB2_FULL_35_7]
MMGFNRKYFTLLVLTVAFFFTQCSPDKADDDGGIGISDKIIKDTADMNKVKVIFYNIPSPVEMTNILQRSGVAYNPDLLNSIKKSDKYLSSSQIALNLGVYGADLSYVRMFDQIQESVSYLAVIRKFTEKLGIPSDKGQLTVGRLEENVNNRDSLLSIISETYANADVYLKENNRGSTASLIILGGWVEALHIACSLVDPKNPSKEIMLRVTEQKFSLKNMIELLTNYKDDETITAFLPKLEELKNIYDKTSITATDAQASTNNKTKVTTIDSKPDVQITLEHIAEINSHISKIREEIVK